MIRTTILASLLIIVCLTISCESTKEHIHTPGAESSQTSNANRAPVIQIDDAKLREMLQPRGKPLLVNFWATWCGPCREEFPDLVRIDEDYRERIDFITISLDFPEELETGVPKFLAEMNARMPTYLLVSADENAVISAIAKDWNGALPSTILYKTNGEMAYLRQGKVIPQTLRAEIDKALGEK